MSMDSLSRRLEKLEAAKRAAEAAPDDYVPFEPGPDWWVQLYAVTWQLRSLLGDLSADTLDPCAPTALFSMLEDLHEWKYVGAPAELADAPGMAELLEQVRAEE